MAVRTKEEILNAVRAKIGDSTADEDLALIEDVSDTLNEMSDITDWRKKYEDNDAEWRKKYRDRFFHPDTPEPETDLFEPEQPKTYRYDDLFKEE